MPNQFNNLLTNSNDYTCGGVQPCSTWVLPSLPAAGSSYTDPVFNTTTYRLTTAGNTRYGAYIQYSESQAWNSDNTKMFLCDGNDDVVIYDATTTPPTPIGGKLQRVSGAVTCGNANQWSFQNPNLFYYLTSSGELHQCDLSTLSGSNYGTLCATTNSGGDTRIASFSCTSDAAIQAIQPNVTAGTSCSNFGMTPGNFEGKLLDKNDKYFTFFGSVYDGVGTTYIDFFVYDCSSKPCTKVYQDKWYKAICQGGTLQGCYITAIVNTTLGTDIAAGTRTVTPASMSGIYPGWALRIGGSNPETIMVTATTSTTFTAVFVNAHSSTDAVTKNCDPVSTSCITNGIHGAGIFPDGSGVYFQYETNGCSDNNSHCISNTEANWARGKGTEAFSLSGLTGSGPLTYLGGMSCWVAHNDVGYDVNGYPVWVAAGGCGAVAGNEDFQLLEVARLDQLSTSTLTNKHFLLPCGMTTQAGHTCNDSNFTNDHNATLHISMQGTIGSNSITGLAGYGLVSVPMVRGWYVGATNVGMPDMGGTAFGAAEQFATKIDWNATELSNLNVWRIGRHWSIRDGDYNAESHSSPNRNFTAITWGSNWNARIVDTTLQNAITSTGAQTITLASSTNLKTGIQLMIDINGTNPEICIPDSVSGATVHCPSIAHTHSAGVSVYAEGAISDCDAYYGTGLNSVAPADCRVWGFWMNLPATFWSTNTTGAFKYKGSFKVI